MVGRSFFAVTQAFFGISPALVYLVAGLQGTHGDLSAGPLVAFTTLQSRLLIPIVDSPATAVSTIAFLLEPSWTGECFGDGAQLRVRRC